jgi:hypothetical protein
VKHPDPKVVFAASLSRVTGEGEQLIVNFNGSDQGELRKHLTQAREVIHEHVQKHNKKVLEVTAQIRENAERAKADIIRADRRELVAQGLLRPDLVDAILDGGNGAADPAGPADLQRDS